MIQGRQTKMLIDFQALVNNYKVIQKIHPDKKILPILKAKGYGIGTTGIHRFIQELNIDTLGTAIVDEGIELREEANYKGDIIVLNQPAINEISNIVKYKITTSCCYIEFLRKLDEEAKKQNVTSKVHIELETGMGRTGIQIQNLEDFINQAKKLKNIIINGVFTHFSTSDTDLEYTKKQIELFEKGVEYIKSEIDTIEYIHCGNSSAIIQVDNLPGNMIRPGIILYGYLPDKKLKEKIKLKPSCVLKTKISYIKTVETGTSISYGRKFITNKKSIIANVPIGYADGIRRELSNKGSVIVKGEKAPIVGAVCMDSFMIDVTDIPDIKIDDEVYIWDNEKITLEEIAEQCNTINYEILSTISDRVVREMN